jgi:hypothetical protein
MWVRVIVLLHHMVTLLGSGGEIVSKKKVNRLE